jgi:hypothetical protein
VIGPRRGWRRRGCGAFGLLLASAGVTGCTTARSDLGTSAGPCYVALPTATKAVDGEGHLLGVQRVTAESLQRQAPELYQQVPTTYAASTRLCVVAFSGRFDAASVTDASGRPSGGLAVVVSTASGNRLLGTVIFAKPPLRIGRSEVG